MKIIMYQGTQKYAMRGTNKVCVGEDEVEKNGKIETIKIYMGGDYTFDNAFKNGSDEFREFAIKLWNDNVIESW